MRNAFIILFLLLIHDYVLNAQTRSAYKTQLSHENIKIDGSLSEAIWKLAPIASHFTQTIPSPDKPSLYNTEIRILYTQTSIIIGAEMMQPRALLSQQLSARDALNNVNADVLSIFFDTYDDHQNGFVFRVSSAGVQQDEKLSGGEEDGDISWDAVWKSKVVVDDLKWTAEIEIPFSALRFAKKKEMQWGLNFLRVIRKINESSYWNPINVQKQGFLAQTGKLLGLNDIEPPVRLFLYPYVSSGFLKQKEMGVETRRWLKSGGLDIKYGLNESFTLDLTLIPDFSQVISDNLIRNLSPFEQQLNENRPFFTEGTELFTKGELFYTRRVGSTPNLNDYVKNEFGDTSKFRIKKNPNVTTLLNAFKISGRNKHNIGIGIFNAIGAPMKANIEDKQDGSQFKVETEPMTNYNVLVFDKALRGQSSISLVNTNVIRKGGNRDANVSAIIWNQFNKKEDYAFTAFAKMSVVNTNKINQGTSLGATIAKVSGKFTCSFSAISISPQFDKTDLGLQYDFNQTAETLSATYTENKPKWKRLQFYKLGTNHTWTQNTNPFIFKNYNAQVFGFLLFKNFWDITYSVETSPLGNRDFYQLGAFNKSLYIQPYLYNNINGSSDSRKKLFWAFYVGYGISFIKHLTYGYTNQTLRYRFSPKLEATISIDYTHDDSKAGYAFYDELIQQPIVGRRDVKEYIGELSMQYNLSPTLNFTARFRHYNNFIKYTSFYQVDGVGQWDYLPYSFKAGYDENYNLQNVDVFFNWIFRPGSRFVLSYKQWLNDAYLLNATTSNSYFENVQQVIKSPHAFELSARFIYFLDYNSFKKTNGKRRTY